MRLRFIAMILLATTDASWNRAGGLARPGKKGLTSGEKLDEDT
jgi:hypothetical protein